jgi:hypothetical protein
MSDAVTWTSEVLTSGKHVAHATDYSLAIGCFKLKLKLKL